MNNLPILKIKENNSVDVIKIDEDRLTALGEFDVLHRVGGRFGGNAYQLANNFEWIIGVDEEGVQILVPLRKESE